MKNILFLLLLAIAAPAFAQKVDHDKDTIYVDKKPFAVLDKTRGAGGSDLSLRSLEGKELAYFKFMEYSHYSKANSGNPKGRVLFFEVTFLGDGQKCEIRHYASKKKLSEEIVEAGLIVNNAIDAEAEKRYVSINGKKFSEERDRLNGPDVIIIKQGN